MQKKQASGLDTTAMIPVYFAIFSLAAVLFLPWISVPELKYSGMESKYNIFHMETWLGNMQRVYEIDLYFEMERMFQLLKITGVILSVILVISIFAVFIFKRRSKQIVRGCFVLNLLYFIAEFVMIMKGNMILNTGTGVENQFLSLTINSRIQFTSWGFAAVFLSIIFLVIVDFVYDYEREPETVKFEERRMKEQGMTKRTGAAILLILTAIPLVILFGIYFLNDRSSVFIGICIITISMLPFALVFEGRRPQARELILIAVMSAIAVVGRMAFFMVPQFKPVTAIVIITGIGLGPEAGFLTGVVSAFVSNFFFGQGPWTPWQMFAFGIIGLLAGVIFKKKKNKYVICIFGGIATFLIYGLIMDVSSVLNFTGKLTWTTVKASLISGIPFNIIHGISTVIFLFVLFRPMESKLERMKKKYGILE